ncbi:MAG: flagellar hook-basal body complex protein FliE [Defluviitaleaceae bacterium]|nr:flagellar hook-basal body complex protein FliE [Defluviitaleaceae bacterium]
MDLTIPSFTPTIIGGTSQVATQFSDQLTNAVNIAEEGRSAFDSFLQAAMEVVGETNLRQIESDIAQVNFATGATNDMLDVILAQERATSSLNFTVQVTNRIIEAYREIMRMQV